VNRAALPAPATDPAQPDRRAIIELRGVARTYPGPAPVHALHPTDLTAHQGDYVAIVGPSGSGKSTLLNLLGLLDRPTSGHYLLDGIDTGLLTESRRAALRAGRIGFVFQSFHLLQHRSATENVALAQVYSGTRRTAREAAARAALHTVKLSHRIDALPSTMSGGEQQRVAIARALVNEPSLLLCDEPTGNLDSVTSAAVLDLLDELNAAGTTILVITHDPVTATRARRTLAIRDGHLTEEAVITHA
jgi:putative ABC transport system ATP-binding protein